MNGDRANDIVGVQAQVVLSFALVNLSVSYLSFMTTSFFYGVTSDRIFLFDSGGQVTDLKAHPKLSHATCSETEMCWRHCLPRTRAVLTVGEVV